MAPRGCGPEIGASLQPPRSWTWPSTIDDKQRYEGEITDLYTIIGSPFDRTILPHIAAIHHNIYEGGFTGSDRRAEG